MSVVCTARTNQTNLAYVAKSICTLLDRFKRSIFIPERNRSGGMLIDIILTAMENSEFDPFTRIFNKHIQDWNTDSPALSTLDITLGTIRKKMGFTTTSGANSRELLYSSVFSTAMEQNNDRIYDSVLTDEIRGLTVRNGRIDHSTGGHDDLLVAYLIACYFVYYGKHHGMYGLRPDEVLSKVNDNGEQVSPEEKLRQRAVTDRIKELKSLLGSPLPTYVTFGYKRELKNLQATIDSSLLDKAIVSVEQVKQENETARVHHVNFQDTLKWMSRMTG